nr:porin [uncultured Holophaga sp.]
MKKAIALSGLAALMVALPAAAQSVKVGGDVQIWYNQVLDSNLRNNSVANYYNLRSEFKEDGFSMRRVEIKAYGEAVPGLDYEVMMDPSISTSTSNPMILQDAFLTWKAADGLAVRVGQMKTLQTYEGNISSTELMFAERSQVGRVFGDKRDRGAYAAYTTGNPKDFQVKVTAGVFNGMSDVISGKGADTDPQKDFVLRADFVMGAHKFGAYTLQGVTDKAASSASSTAVPSTWTGVTVADINDNKDKTTNYGAYYVYKSGPWYFDAEVITGLLGRRSASFGTTATRQYLDQKFFGYYVTGAYTMGNHTFAARYDFMNYNQGDKWYTAYNPYTESAVGVSTGTDYTPKFDEITLGYTYAWTPAKVKAANFKLNYIIRSKNFLKPTGTETGEQGGDNLVAAFCVAF